MEVMFLGFAAAMIAGFVVLLAVVVPAQLRAERRRREARRAWAWQHGWHYEERPRVAWTGRMPGRNARGVRWMMTGRIGQRWVSVADYYYESSSGDSTSTHNYVAVVVQLERPLPWVGVAARGAFSQLGRSLFGDKPTATGHPGFDSRFRVEAAEPRWAHELIGRPLIEAHLANAVPCWSVAGNQLLAHYSGKLGAPELMGRYADPLLRVADLLGQGVEPWVTVPPPR
ncbi:hypothetical protein [Nocardia sp. NPDC048505]|uniref:hypothetical protein n=1 Tax=unclassified Nocardia TaxID=2637762 RepID=UPI003402633E